jgi:hypothetical protein
MYIRLTYTRALLNDSSAKLFPKVGTTQEAGQTAQGGSVFNTSIPIEDNLRRLLFQGNTLVVERYS